MTAGGTREAIDPVRYVGNRSSGKMGHALANVAARLGARVVLVTTAQPPVDAGVEVVRVESAQEMHDAVMARAPPRRRRDHGRGRRRLPAQGAVDRRRSRRPTACPTSCSEPTTDILAALGRAKRPGQVVVGFAAETERLPEHAAAKLAAKRVDLIVANDVSAPDAGFEVDTNRALAARRRRERRGNAAAHQGATGGSGARSGRGSVEDVLGGPASGPSI